MDFILFLQGCIVGFSIAAPIGPVNVLCMRRTLSRGRFSGFISGLGAASADTLYGFIAAFGLTAASTMFMDQRMWFRILGSVFLIVIGMNILFAKDQREKALPAFRNNYVFDFISTFFLAITNPLTIVAFTAIFAVLGLGMHPRGHVSTGILVLGVFTGSILWWLILISGFGFLRTKFGNDLHWVNRVMGLLIVVFGAIVFMGI